MWPLSFHEIDSQILSVDDIIGYENEPSYRKATMNMVLATKVCHRALEKHQEIDKLRLAFVLGTAFGEVTSSLNYLKQLRSENLASPNLFQNSLHNSTLGFVTLQLGLRGPAITVVNGEETVQATKIVSQSMLALSDYVLGCVIDIVPDKLNQSYVRQFPAFEGQLGIAQSWLWKKV